VDTFHILPPELDATPAAIVLDRVQLPFGGKLLNAAM
jgi:hypothetical protein